ncbi:toxin-antitoxin system HicB family antitoxin [Amycolatopsis sp., V23-08]|uniref:Toxin-antitoxin system HicB family antitoxin n=1 Tax=Amycolatopsis heterodermiae TaxID=3110235 RepID=A0ABU5RJB6_9PSEU|nr:toxin-antitoxin system HicB family antitoxin [Amycolatopsis sp., V23-08]MEA5366382.1 toxin-antitoxin system HicB family antitoxin [Amycolatopsis sp., V23-08]
MDLTPFVDELRRELAVAAEAAGEEAVALAERLTAPLESAIRLTLLDALSAAADEITRDLAPGSVEVRLRRRDAEFAVSVPTAPEPEPQETPAPPLEPDDGAVARINLRLPEQLKQRVEEAAARERISTNAWLVRAASAGLGPDKSAPRRRNSLYGDNYTGWVR